MIEVMQKIQTIYIMCLLLLNIVYLLRKFSCEKLSVLFFPKCFEGMKAFKGIDGRVRLFRPVENMKRLSRSAVAASLPVSHMTIT